MTRCYLTKFWYGKRWRYVRTRRHWGFHTYGRFGVVSYLRAVDADSPVNQRRDVLS